MAGEKVFNLPCPFAGQERTDGVDEAAPGNDQFGSDDEQALLQRDYAVEPLGCQAPASLGVAPPGAATGARRVDKNEIGKTAPVGELVEFFRRVEQPGLD